MHRGLIGLVAAYVYPRSRLHSKRRYPDELGQESPGCRGKWPSPRVMADSEAGVRLRHGAGGRGTDRRTAQERLMGKTGKTPNYRVGWAAYLATCERNA